MAARMVRAAVNTVGIVPAVAALAGVVPLAGHWSNGLAVSILVMPKGNRQKMQHIRGAEAGA